MKYEEHEIQKGIIQWARAMPFPINKLYAIPNGGKRSIREAVRLKQEGVLAGIPDLFLPVPSGRLHGLFLEVKAAKGKLTREQVIIGDKLIALGYGVMVVRSVRAAIDAIEGYLG